MANVNKRAAIVRATGLPSKGQILMSAENTDKVPAVIQNQNGSQSPAALTEGEFVITVPAIIALGKGNYDAGLQLLTQLHEELKAEGERIMGQQQGQVGLGSIPMQ